MQSVAMKRPLLRRAFRCSALASPCLFLLVRFTERPGVFLTAQTGSGDPTVGPTDAAARLCRSRSWWHQPSWRSGRLRWHALLGALTLMLIVNLMLVFDVPAFYSSVAEGVPYYLSRSSLHPAATYSHWRQNWPTLQFRKVKRQPFFNQKPKPLIDDYGDGTAAK